MKTLSLSPRFCFSLVVLLLLFSPVVVAQRKDAAAKNAVDINRLSVQQQDALDLMKTLAQELKSEFDKLTAATLQARLADVLWNYDQSFATEVFRWAFDAAHKPPAEDLPKTERASYAVRQAASIREVLTRLGAHDQKRAEVWLKALQEENSEGSSSAESSQFRSELLIQIALQLAPTNPAQAQRLGLLSLSGHQIPEDFGRLLFALSNVSRNLSDELFRTAVATLRRNDFAYDPALFTLTNYVFNSRGDLYPDARVADAQLLANYFVDAAWRQARGGGIGLPESSASFYSLMEVRGWPIVSRYAAERVPELQGQMRELASRLSQAQLENTTRLRATQQQQIAVSSKDSYDIDKQVERATNEKDPQVRDALLNSVAHSLMRSDNDKAREVAAKIDDVDIREQAEDDINLVRIQQLLLLRSYEDARKTALKLRNKLVQAKVLAELANKSLSENKDTGRAAELLSEAAEITSKTEPLPDKLMAFLLIANQFARFDPIRGFETLGNAIKVLNQLKGEEAAPKSILSKPRLLTIKTYTVINGNEMSTSDRATLDSIDFSQVAPFVAHDYMQTRLLGNKIENPLRRAKFLIAVASAALSASSAPRLGRLNIPAP